MQTSHSKATLVTFYYDLIFTNQQQITDDKFVIKPMVNISFTATYEQLQLKLYFMDRMEVFSKPSIVDLRSPKCLS